MAKIIQLEDYKKKQNEKVLEKIYALHDEVFSKFLEKHIEKTYKDYYNSDSEKPTLN